MEAQRGSILLEYLVVMVLTLLAAFWAVSAWSERRETLELESKALWMQAVQKAVAHYIERFSHELITADPHSAQTLAGVAVADWQHPTIAELKALGVLPDSFSAHIEEKVRLWVFRQAPACEDEFCFLHGVIAAQRPLTNRHGVADAKQLSIWRELTHGAGLVVQAPYQQWIAGSHLRWPNEVGRYGALPDGTVALAVQGDELWHRYLRVRDERDPLFQNQVTVSGPVVSEQALSTDGYLAMRTQAQLGEPCPEQGALAHDRNFPALMTCKNGHWSWVLGQDGGHYIRDQRGNCSHPVLGDTSNPVSGSCACTSLFYAKPIAFFTDNEGNSYYSYLCRPRISLH